MMFWMTFLSMCSTLLAGFLAGTLWADVVKNCLEEPQEGGHAD